MFLQLKILDLLLLQSIVSLLVLSYNLNQYNVVVQFKMDFNIDQKIQAATQPLIKRIASLEEELRIIKLLLQQSNVHNKASITHKQNQPERLTAQKTKNITQKRNNKTQEETSKNQNAYKITKGTKAVPQNKDTKTEQIKKTRPESKKGGKKQVKDAGNKVPFNQTHENQTKNEIVSQAHSQIVSTVPEVKSIVSEEKIPVTVGQSMRQTTLQNQGSVNNQIRMEQLSLAQNKTFSVEEQNLMDKVNQEIQMMRRQETETAQIQGNLVAKVQQDNSSPVVQTILLSVQTQKPQIINNSTLIQDQKQVKIFVTTEGSLADTQQTIPNLKQETVTNIKTIAENETSQIMLNKAEITAPKTAKRPSDKTSFNQTRKQTPKNIKQNENKTDKLKNIFEAKPKTETKIVNASMNKSIVKQSMNKQKTALKSAVNSAKKPETKQAKLKSEQKNESKSHSISQANLNEQVIQSSEKQQDKTILKPQTMQTVNV